MIAWILATLPMQAHVIQVKAPVYLFLNVQEGKYIQLSDRSLWLVAPKDRDKSSNWLFPAHITLAGSGDPDYPYLMKNHANEEAIRVRLVKN